MRSFTQLLWVCLLTFDLCAAEVKGVRHWAFESIINPGLPETKNKAWVRNPIDRFILARLEARRIDPSPVAPEHTLVRRLSLDLTGLPPEPKVVKSFKGDKASDAYIKLVKRLMASPHYGERMAQNWLDLARFADTSGYAADRTRNVWPYRDWVIRAFNENKPYNQFSIEQLAGDLLPQATAEQRVASAFHRHAMQAKGNNPRKEEFRVKGIVDRLQTTGRTWLGLTLECAECHDHKHDPISQKEYYQLFAIFNNVPHLGVGYNVHGPRMTYTPYSESRSRLKKQQALLQSKLGPVGIQKQGGLIEEWQKETHVKDATKFSLNSSLSITADIQTKAKIGDIVSKYDWQAGQRSYVFGVGGEGDAKAAPGKLFAWFSSDAATFRGVVAYGSQVVNDGKPHHVAMVFNAGKSVRFFVDGVEDSSVQIEGAVPKTLAKSSRGLAIGVGYDRSAVPNVHRFQGKLSNVRLYDRVLGNPAGLNELKPEAIEYRRLSVELSKLATRDLEIPVMAEQEKPRATHIHIRGDFNNRGEVVRPSLPKIFPPLNEIPKGRQMNRLDFARWLFDRKNPLTARVEVNRIWQHHFGVGLVRTAADFGRHGEIPSHPKLLDWLALHFMENGWDRKAIHQLIVESATYRQASVHRGDLMLADPENQLLARFPRIRLPAEQIRDSALVVSSLLNKRIGGPSVFPSQPPGLYEERGQNTPGNSNFTWKDSTGPDRYRRSLYTYWKRMMLHPVLSAFDAPTRQVCIAKRQITNTPQQALVALNAPMFTEAATALVKRLEKEGYDGDSKKITAVFQICLSRDPDVRERQQCLAFLKHQRDQKQANEWSALTSVLMNLDEWLTRE